MFTYEEVADRCQALKPVQLRSLARSLLQYDKEPAPGSKLSTGEALLLWIADLLEWMQVCNQDQRTLLLQELKEEISKLGTAIEENFSEGKVPIFNIGFADRRWATCTTLPHFFDLDEGIWEKELSEPPLETISYSIASLFMRNHRVINGQGRQENARDTSEE